MFTYVCAERQRTERNGDVDKPDRRHHTAGLPGILCLLMASAPSGVLDPAECLVYGPSSETQTNTLIIIIVIVIIRFLPRSPTHKFQQLS